MPKTLPPIAIGEQIEHQLSGGNVIVLNYADVDCIEVFCCEDVSPNAEVRWSLTFKSLAEAEKEYFRFD